ncbi:hypothetical protein AGIG_G16568 [Arapaima gigas]
MSVDQVEDEEEEEEDDDRRCSATCVWHLKEGQSTPTGVGGVVDGMSLQSGTACGGTGLQATQWLTHSLPLAKKRVSKSDLTLQTNQHRENKGKQEAAVNRKPLTGANRSYQGWHHDRFLCSVSLPAGL